jgi:hypothetical protein
MYVLKLSCPYARPHTRWPVTGMPTMSLGLMYVYRVNVHSLVTVCYWVFRVSAFWWLYKKAKPFPFPLVFLEFLCMRVASIVYLDFLDAQGGYYTTIVYIHLHSFFAIQFNSRKTLLLLLNVESNKILLLLNS